jgi:hypothetical protein
MRRRIFNVGVVISLSLVALGVTAIFSSAALTKYSNYPAASPPIQTETIVKLYRGQVEILRFDPAGRSITRAAFGDSYQFNWDGSWMPITSKAIAGFEAGTLPSGQWVGPPGTGGYYIAFPVWPLAVPFLIAPALWLRSWQRKRREARLDSSTAFPSNLSNDS